MQFMKKPKLAVDIHNSYKPDIINNTSSTNFLGLTLESTLSWKTHIEQPSSKLNSACYLIRSLRSVISTKNLRILYLSYVHSIMTDGIIFWDSLPYSDNIFKLHKRTIRIMMNVGNRVSCHELFKKLSILLYIHNIYCHYYCL
jgi:predicted membrane protein